MMMMMMMMSCYCALRQIRSIMPSLPSHALNTLVAALVHSRLDYYNVVFAGLPACDIQRLQSVLNTAVRPSGRRLIAMRSRDFSATRPPLAASQTARWVQAVYDGTSLLVRRRTILPGGPDHTVGRCNCQTWFQICAAASRSVAVPRTISSLGDRSFAAAGPRAWNKLPPPLRRVYSPAGLLLLNVILRHFYTITLLIHIVRRPSCVSALTSP